MSHEVTISELHYRVLPTTSRSRRLVELTSPLIMRVKFGQNNVDSKIGILRIIAVVPVGMQTDLATTPRLLWWLFPPDGAYQEAAIIHDYLYSISTSRWLADAMFRYAMEKTGVPLWKRWLLWAGVRLGGWIWWRAGQ